jgi:hypothetical protein
MIVSFHEKCYRSILYLKCYMYIYILHVLFSRQTITCIYDKFFFFSRLLRWCPDYWNYLTFKLVHPFHTVWKCTAMRLLIQQFVPTARELLWILLITGPTFEVMIGNNVYVCDKHNILCLFSNDLLFKCLCLSSDKSMYHFR